MTKMARHVLVFLTTVLIIFNAKGASIPDPIQSPDAKHTNTKKVETKSSDKSISNFGFRIIRNSTMPCKQIKLQQGGLYRYHTLSDDDKLEILEAKGGKFLKGYMARSAQEARNSFFSLLDVDFKPKDKRLDPNLRLTKAAIKYHLDKEAEEDQDSEEELGGNSASNEEGLKNGTSSDKKDNESILVRPRDVGIPEHIVDEQTGGETVLESCLTRGSHTRDKKYLHMCTTCSATTNLGTTYWPHMVNEAKCIVNDPYCFLVDEIPHGLCRNKIIPISVLRKLDGYCELALKNGETVIVDDWIAWDHVINSGCECVINVNSEFAQYVGKYESP